MDSSISYNDLLDACAEPGCPVCQLVLATVDHYIDSMNYDSVNDRDFRAATRAAHGFCNVHAHQWLREANVLGTAMIYRQVCDDTTAELTRLAFHASGFLEEVASRLEGNHGNHALEGCDLLAVSGPCPVCAASWRRERQLLSTLVESIGEESFRTRYVASDGLCLPHLREALCLAGDEDAFTALRDDAVERQEALSGQLAEIIRKHDYRFREEPVGEERGATGRAVDRFAGAPDVVPFSQQLDRESR